VLTLGIQTNTNGDKIMKKNYSSFLSVLLCSTALNAYSQDVNENEMSGHSAGFEYVKGRLGSWEGTLNNGYSGEQIDVSYQLKLTSGGSTILETLLEDGDEMLTTYSENNGELIVKHYCVLGTEPVLRVSSVAEDHLNLTLDHSASGLHAGHDNFVTEIKYTQVNNDPDTVVLSYKYTMEGVIYENSGTLYRVE
jgi:hypothetical protein